MLDHAEARGHSLKDEHQKNEIGLQASFLFVKRQNLTSKKTKKSDPKESDLIQMGCYPVLITWILRNWSSRVILDLFQRNRPNKPEIGIRDRMIRRDGTIGGVEIEVGNGTGSGLYRNPGHSAFS